MSLKKHANALKTNFSGITPEAGCDEAGRGCLAGPVVAAAVILPNTFEHPLLNDSKQLTHTQRETVRLEIIEKAVDYAIAFVDRETIDKINILNASILGMQQALDQLKIRPEFVIVDGNRFKPYSVPYKTIVKGDSLYKSIAAASILAKTERDRYMENLAKEHPEYNWQKNKGYPTAEHRDALRKFGVTPHHRQSFNLFDRQLKIEF
jgi:ribonuclease HII